MDAFIHCCVCNIFYKNNKQSNRVAIARIPSPVAIVHMRETGGTPGTINNLGQQTSASQPITFNTISDTVAPAVSLLRTSA